jgi:hypothetical protein
MSFRIVLLLTMLVSFVVSFGVMWRGSRAQPPAIVVERAAIEPPVAPPPIRSLPPTAQPSQVPDASVPSASMDAAPRAAASPNTPLETALPVQLRFRHINHNIQATIVNVSKEILTVDISVQQSGAQTTLELTPGMPTLFGVHDGLELHSADEVTLRSASYLELAATVP